MIDREKVKLIERIANGEAVFFSASDAVDMVRILISQRSDLERQKQELMQRNMRIANECDRLEASVKLIKEKFEKLEDRFSMNEPTAYDRVRQVDALKELKGSLKNF